MKKAVLLNDTSYENHHGCNIVVKNITINLRKRGINLIATNPIGRNWKKSKSFLNALSNSDLIILNGEGTIHHDSDYAYSLLEIVEYTDKPCFLINCTYENNSEKFAKLVSKFKKIYVRESFSKLELEKFNITSYVVPDMTFYNLSGEFDLSDIKKIYITDSHDIKKSEKLYQLSKKFEIVFLPIISPFIKFSNIKNFFKRIKYKIFSNLGEIIKLRYKYNRFKLVKDENELLNCLNNCELLISARFHAICLALHFNTPFIAMSSNTFKIEALLKDIDINSNRIVNLEQVENILTNLKNEKMKYSFSNDEIQKITDYKRSAIIKIDDMFDSIANY